MFYVPGPRANCKIYTEQKQIKNIFSRKTAQLILTDLWNPTCNNAQLDMHTLIYMQFFYNFIIKLPISATNPYTYKIYHTRDAIQSQQYRHNLSNFLNVVFQIFITLSMQRLILTTHKLKKEVAINTKRQKEYKVQKINLNNTQTQKRQLQTLKDNKNTKSKKLNTAKLNYEISIDSVQILVIQPRTKIYSNKKQEPQPNYKEIQRESLDYTQLKQSKIVRLLPPKKDHILNIFNLLN
eukprot:TRINITY_DN168_c1_g1_i3.p1 TRINITY_DN168_c1_g1~~TRINITY_DN168_c1_g1_i3.p1  ORF type:complete len:238 (+),score=-25.22 TRINITY_DN168_c1_g1_i3:2-715(+)